MCLKRIAYTSLELPCKLPSYLTYVYCFQAHGNWDKNTLLAHLKSYRVLNDSQRGFLKSQQTIDPTIYVFARLLFGFELVALRSNKAVYVIYLDIATAVDCVVHYKLIAKLICYGVNIILVMWIESFLADHFQYT